MTPGLLALQFLLCAALIGVAGYGLCQSADRMAQATGLTGGWIGLALLATVTSLPRTRFGHHMIGLVMRPQGRELRVLSWVSAGLLVLGARGAGLLQRLVVGSTSERLLRRSTRPMLVVKQTPQGPYRRALVALDFLPWSAQAIALVRCVAPQARVLLLNVFEAPFEGRLQLAGVDAPTIELYRQQARHKARQQLDTLAQQAGLQPAQWDGLRCRRRSLAVHRRAGAGA